MKIALLQLNPIVGDLVGNAQMIEKAVQQAASLGADLAITSELALLGYPPRDLLLYPDFVHRATQRLGQLADSLRESIPLVVGTVQPNPAPEGRALFNGAAWLEAGEIRHWIHKSLLPTYDVFDEDRYFEPAQQREPIRFRGRQLGFSICEDVWNDRDFWQHRRYKMDPIEEMSAAGADVLINLSASPFSVGKQTLRVKMLSALARKHHLSVVYVNQVGGNDDLIFDGASFVLDPAGEVIAQAPAFQPDVVCVDLEQPAPPSLPAIWPTSTPAELFQALVLGTRDYVFKCGFRQVLLGLSGGIDSAVTAVIAVEALGSANVLGVLMPSPYSSPSSLTDAQALAEALGIPTYTLPIAPMMQAFEQVLAQPLAGFPPDITEENLQSRIRGTTLMALSNKLGHMLLTTGNKSELAVGYCTIYGDMSGGLAVISDVPKTQVYQLAEWINRHQQVIPTSTLTKPPSAELRPDQRDSDSLPAYEVLDAILSRHIEQHQSHDQLVAAGFDTETVQKVLRLVKIAEFKRHQAAPGLRVTDRAFGTGWRMPIARR
ncbi:MAG: NAD+ synthase [Cyanobacteriota bacterium]|nr:NAD+ synthase [Cyanobacteriota bacterium]